MRERESGIFKIARSNLVRSRKRTSSTVLALMVGLFMVMLIATIRSSFQYTLTTWIDDVLSADLLVSSSGRMVVFEMQPLDESLQSELLSIPGVRDPGPDVVSAQRVIRFRDGDHRYVIKAVDRPADWTHFKSLPTVEGTDREALGKSLFENTEPSVLISENYFLAHREKVATAWSSRRQMGAHPSESLEK